MARFKRKPVILLCDYRTGGTFLSLALDGHPDVFWARGEPLSDHGAWHRAMNTAKAEHILRGCLTQPLCSVSGCKVTFRQMTPGCWKLVKALSVSIILLTRNILRASVSAVIRSIVRKGAASRAGRPHHTLASVPVTPIHLPLSLVLSGCRKRVDNLSRARDKIATLDLPVLELDYLDVFGYEGANTDRVVAATAIRICTFLGVKAATLIAPLRRVNNGPLSAVVENWSELEKAIRASSHAHCLVDEEGWVRENGHWTK